MARSTSASSARTRRGAPLVALAGYALLSLALFGRGALRDGGDSVVGQFGSDQATFIWLLAWWPHALTDGLALHGVLDPGVTTPARQVEQLSAAIRAWASA